MELHQAKGSILLSGAKKGWRLFERIFYFNIFLKMPQNTEDAVASFQNIVNAMIDKMIKA